MFVYPLSNNLVRLYSKGIEKEYFGTKIEYYNNTNTFLFFHYTSYIRIYVINGMKEDFQLVQCTPKINRIITLENTEAKRFMRFFNDKIKNEDFLFYAPPLFFRECRIILSEKKYMNKLTFLYEKYKSDIKNGKVFPQV